MGIFSRKKEIKRDTEIADNSSNKEEKFVPTGLSFLLSRDIVDPYSLSTYYSCIELIANSIAGIPIYVRSKEDNKIVKHNFDTAISSSDISKFNIIKMLIFDVYNNGNGYLHIKRDGSGIIKSLEYVSPNDVTVYHDNVSRKTYYQLNYSKALKVEPINIIHIYKNSLDGYVGRPISAYAKKILQLASDTDASASDFFKAGCNVNGVLQAKKWLDTEQKMEAYEEWVSSFQHKKRGANVAVLGNDFEYQQIGLNSTDAQLLQSREFNVLEICRYFNINPILVGVNTGSAYKNLEQAQLDFIIHTLLPWINSLEDEFNRKVFLPSERERFYIDFDEDKIMFSDKQSTCNYYTTLVKNGILSINEARSALGFVEKEGCDDLIIPYTNVNNNKVGTDNQGEGNPDSEEEKNTEEKEDEK